MSELTSFTSRLKVVAGLCCALCSPLAGSVATDARFATQQAQTLQPALERGRLLILPGIHNTEFHLSSFVRAASSMLPNFEIDILPWGTPFMGISNLRAYERNVQTAHSIAADLSSWRYAHPDAALYVVGYSGGGGIAALVVDALPADVAVDRLVLIAPAISPTFPVEEKLLPHVNEFIVNYASDRDAQVGLGTKVFGTIDRIDTVSAGYSGFSESSARLLEWQWSTSDMRVGHLGNHVAYLGRRWQMSTLLPALDPEANPERIEVSWRSARQAGSSGRWQR
jgi:pimeloyl-ACP methyl ester carboxylesterase